MPDPLDGADDVLDTAAFVVSIDTELAWGIHDRGRDAVEALGPGRAEHERSAIRSILDIMEAHRIPATWAVVGHLFLESCKPTDGRPHPDLARPEYDWHTGDWFDLDPGSDLAHDPLWYGADIVAMIRGAQPPHEIGSHSFSHLIAGDPGCSAAAFESDVSACVDVAGASGVALRSYVFSKNSIGHLGALERHGFIAYRGHRPAPFAGLSGPLGGAARLVDRISPRRGSAVYPRRQGGLWDIPGTNFYGPSLRRRGVPLARWVDRQIRRLDIAAETRSLFHLWFHPQDLLGDTDQALSGLDRILAHAAELRDRGTLRTVTMGGLAAALDEAEGLRSAPH